MATIEEWKERFDALSDEGLQAIALIRMVEVTNGCIQYAFRDKDARALSVEQTREAMKLSMGIITHKKVTLNGTTEDLPEEIQGIMNEVRELYIAGFKNGDVEKYDEFMRASTANVLSVGEYRLLKAEAIVRANFSDTFTNEYITYGRMYLDNLVRDYRD